ncbi:hypothetical protein D9758_009380 [Tetrapyrgos nigripes]|uniref:Uncharacterized protein n=1 Tax=Tetrapyrgos nigripes TaxID=182062 RepID=A0A8H5FX22_9AGAR|nr:hypothetical protein D9758_009380 [Tetrapyrgos nigripes]
MLLSTQGLLFLSSVILSYAQTATSAHASFSVHYPWATRRPANDIRSTLEDFKPFCGIPIRNPQRFAAYQTTFFSFSGHPGDLVTVRYGRTRVARNRDAFPITIASNVPISPTGQLCFDVQMPIPLKENEHGMFLFEAIDPGTSKIADYHCLDVYMVDNDDAKSEDHPAMCARNNDSLIPMPDEW